MDMLVLSCIDECTLVPPDVVSCSVRYPAHIEEIDYEEGKVLIHFKRWNHRYDEWFCWDSPYLRPLEKIQLRKEGLHEEEGCAGFHVNDQVLACWSDCRFYPAKVTAVNKDELEKPFENQRGRGMEDLFWCWACFSLTMLEDQGEKGCVIMYQNIPPRIFWNFSIVGDAKPKERGNEIPSSPENREKFKEQRKAAGNAKKDEDEKTLKTEKRVKQPEKEGKFIVILEKSKVSEKNISKNGKEDKENISENDMEYSVDTQLEKKPENDNVKSPQENTKEPKRKRGRPPITPPTAQEKLKNSSDHAERDQIRRRSSRLSSSISHEILNTDLVTTSAEIQPWKDAVSNQNESEKAQLEIAVEPDQSFSEQESPGKTSQSTALSTDASLQEEKAEDTKSSSVAVRTQEPSAATGVKEHEKNKERKSKDYGRSKSKKKKKKKKRSKPEDDTLSESSMDSLLWSDDDCSQDVDVTTNPDEEAEESDSEIVRCVCEVKEENDFMIQCEECLCWQHGVCMGLLEDNVPEKYTCYICQDPPGQRSSLKYWYEKEWLSNGHMHGLAFLEENYSHQNAKKIVATHQLLGDVQRVIEVLHGLQLKMSILQNKEHPDLKLWCHPWKHITVDEKIHTKHIIHFEENCCKEETASYRTWNGTAEKPSAIPSVEESYITSEHCYQKPRAYYPAIEQRLVVETRGSVMDDGVNRIRENGDDALSERFGWNLDQEICKVENESKHSYSKVRESVSKKGSPDEAIEMKLMEKGKEGVVNSQLQWQLNLLAHVESLQDEVIHRMDFIEKELDVLESWLDYTGELEPPEPLARLPQLKHCIKQLITDLGKVQQIALCCST
ncbi:PHD finger protein 20 isoform X6 [Willisornis vidua]|uniref:PHD finger protein 20 isoform X6 n=1 Tax=Willisornis vidua TaxID=1566151 RepID=A0ABQ9CYU0_9PASS|nr:PHD finger protein 20 isoform X6 [Willisornis vidua]